MVSTVLTRVHTGASQVYKKDFPHQRRKETHTSRRLAKRRVKQKIGFIQSKIGFIFQTILYLDHFGFKEPSPIFSLAFALWVGLLFFFSSPCFDDEKMSKIGLTKFFGKDMFVCEKLMASMNH
jgi:hypothetical protein